MFSKAQQTFSIYQIAEGMKYIHSQRVVHQNLKPSNILISEDGLIKISGFEKSYRMINCDFNKMKEDVYSFGAVAYFILTGKDFIKDEIILNELPLLSQQMIDSYCFTEPEHRPSFENICEVLENNNFNLASLSQNELQEVFQMIHQYKNTITI